MQLTRLTKLEASLSIFANEAQEIVHKVENNQLVEIQKELLMKSARMSRSQLESWVALWPERLEFGQYKSKTFKLTFHFESIGVTELTEIAMTQLQFLEA